MPRHRKRAGDQTGEDSSRKAGGGTVCALCGRVIKAGASATSEPVIYTICPSCKRLPHRNPGSTTSLS